MGLRCDGCNLPAGQADQDQATRPGPRRADPRSKGARHKLPGRSLRRRGLGEEAKADHDRRQIAHRVDEQALADHLAAESKAGSAGLQSFGITFSPRASEKQQDRKRPGGSGDGEHRPRRHRAPGPIHRDQIEGVEQAGGQGEQVAGEIVGRKLEAAARAAGSFRPRQAAAPGPEPGRGSLRSRMKP